MIYVQTVPRTPASVSLTFALRIVGCGSSGGRREMPGIRFGMASNDGSWFAAFRRGTLPGASRVVIYTRYIPGARLGLLQGFRVTYVATWREKTIFEDISSSPIAGVESASEDDVSFAANSDRYCRENEYWNRAWTTFMGRARRERSGWQSRRNGKTLVSRIYDARDRFTTLLLLIFIQISAWRSRRYNFSRKLFRLI